MLPKNVVDHVSGINVPIDSKPKALNAIIHISPPLMIDGVREVINHIVEQ